MATIFPPYVKYLSFLVMIFAILYKYEVPFNSSESNRTTWLLSKSATIPSDRDHVYKVITNVDKYASWYPNVARVEHVQLIPSRVHNREGEKYRLITKFPLIGELPASMVIHTDDRPKRFVYSVDSWLLEMNIIELKENIGQVNSTSIEWSVHTKRRSILFQYFVLPFGRFYKNQLVRETLFTLIMQIRDL